MVAIEKTFETSAQVLWDFLSKTEWIENWWGPQGFEASVAKNEFQVGGKFLWSMEGQGFPKSWNTGHYTEIIPQQKIKYLMSFSDASGKTIPASQLGLPGKWPDEIEVTIELKEVEGKTLVTVTQNGIPTEMQMLSKMGWAQQLEKMETLINQLSGK